MINNKNTLRSPLAAGARFALLTAALFALTGVSFAQNYVERTDSAAPQSQQYYGYDTRDNAQVYVPYSDNEIEREAAMAAAESAQVAEQDAIMSSSSYVDWSAGTFSSDVSLDMGKADIPMPSGKSTAVKRIDMELPNLIKSPLLSLYVDNSNTLGDLVVNGNITLENLTGIIDRSRKTPAVFASGGEELLTHHTINMLDISSTLVRHRTPYSTMRPIDTVATKAYTGIVIDARGSLPVQGEFTESLVYPCFFPKIWTEDMTLIYERNMVEPDVARASGIVHYASSELSDDYAGRAGSDPLRISARKVFGINRCDIVISNDDYLKISSLEENTELLRQGKVVILLNEDELAHRVSVPEKNSGYYVSYQQLRRYIYERNVPDVEVSDAPTGIQITMQGLRFIADSSELLPEERPRVGEIATALRAIVGTGDYTIMVEGHTADVNKPEGQMQLSIERAQEIIRELTEDGLDPSLFTYRGYGGTRPVADNGTDEGRALNRRVEIIVMPRGSYIMRE